MPYSYMACGDFNVLLWVHSIWFTLVDLLVTITSFGPPINKRYVAFDDVNLTAQSVILSPHSDISWNRNENFGSKVFIYVKGI